MVPKGQKGSKIPIPSIERNYERFLYFKLWQKLLQENDIIRDQFPFFYKKNKHIYELNYKIPDKNPHRLIKIYNNDVFDKWIEIYNEGSSKFINSIVCYINSDIKQFGLIRKIFSENSVEIERIELEKHESYNLFLFNYVPNSISVVEVSNILGFFSVVYYYNRFWIIPLS